MQPSEMLVYGVGGTVSVGLLVWLIKFMVKTAFSTKSEVATINVGDNMMKRLTDEIARLEDIIRKQDARIVALEARLEDFRRIEMADMTDIAEMNAVIEASCMTVKSCVSNAKLKVIVDRIRARRMS